MNVLRYDMYHLLCYFHLPRIYCSDVALSGIMEFNQLKYLRCFSQNSLAEMKLDENTEEKSE